MFRKHFNLLKIDKNLKSKHGRRSFFYFLIALVIIGSYFLIFQKIYSSEIYPRVYCCGDFRLSGLKYNEAENLLKISIEKAEKDGFVFKSRTDLGEKEAIIHSNLIALADPDLSRSLVNFNIPATLKEAFQIGRESGFLKKISEMVLSLARDRKIDLAIDVDKQELERILRDNFSDLEKPAESARLAILNNELILIDEKPGFILDYEGAIKELQDNLSLLKNEKIEIQSIQQNSLTEPQDISLMFEQAKEILDAAPYFLAYQDKKWELKPKQLVQWFEMMSSLNHLKQQSISQKKVSLGLNHEKISEYLQTLAEEINIEPIQRRLNMENSRVVEFQSGQPGLILDIEDSVKNITQGILEKKKEINLTVQKIEPESLPADAASLGIKELIGEGKSNFAGSPKNRRHNIEVGAEKLHGTLIKPDEEFSLVKSLGEVNEANGFLPELVIKGDRTIPEYGGGLCQLATTAFRAALNAGLPITERQPHSYRVVYYEPAGMDATIYNPHPDLRFVNDTGYYILWQTGIFGDDLIFKLYGTSDERRVETSAVKVFNITEPGPVKFIETDELTPGEKKKVESAHQGADAEFRNIITFPNGIVREDVWKSRYQPWPEVWLIGKEIEEKSEESPKE